MWKLLAFAVNSSRIMNLGKSVQHFVLDRCGESSRNYGRGTTSLRDGEGPNREVFGGGAAFRPEKVYPNRESLRRRKGLLHAGA